MIREYSRICLVILVLKEHSKVKLGTSKLIFQCFKSIFWTSMSIFDSPTSYCWTSMSISGGPTAYYWTSMSILNSRNSLRRVGRRRAPAGGRWRRQRRRFPKNSGHLAEPSSNVPRNKISRSGNPSLRFSANQCSLGCVLVRADLECHSHLCLSLHCHG